MTARRGTFSRDQRERLRTPHRRALSAVAVCTVSGALAVVPAGVAGAAQRTFGFTGADQTFTVPAGITKIHVVATGAPGGAGGDQSDTTPVIGAGAVATADLTVTPGQVLYVEVGGAGADGTAGAGTGGYNGGGPGSAGHPASGAAGGGGGGGATDIRTAASSAAGSLDSRVVVAGGGGGGGEGQGPPDVGGGAGGHADADGGDGTGLYNAMFRGYGGHAGSDTGGAAGGAGQCTTAAGINGTDGVQGTGGTGGSTVQNFGTNDCDMAGGGGGGGLYGGGGGGAGSSWSDNHGHGGGGGGGGSSGFGAGTSNTSVGVAAATAAAGVTITYTAASYRPDGLIRRATTTDTYVGNGVYNADGTNQTRASAAKRGATATFSVRFQNDGNVSDSYRIKGCSSSTGFGVTYWSGTANISSGVKAGTYTTTTVAPGGTRTIRLEVHVGSTATIGGVKGCLVTGTSTTRATKLDAPKATVKVLRG